MSKWKQVSEQGSISFERRTSTTSGASLDGYVQTNGHWEVVLSIRNHTHDTYDFLEIASGKSLGHAMGMQRADKALERFLRQMKIIAVNFKRTAPPLRRAPKSTKKKR